MIQYFIRIIENTVGSLVLSYDWKKHEPSCLGKSIVDYECYLEIFNISFSLNSSKNYYQQNILLVINDEEMKHTKYNIRFSHRW